MILSLRSISLIALVLMLNGCISTGSGTAVRGSSAGSNTHNASSKIEKCTKTLGTLAFYEDQNRDWYSWLMQNVKVTALTPMLRLLAQQTNCFVIVERGKMMSNMMQERALQNSGELRKGSGFTKGKMVAADYTISPDITFSAKNTGGVGAVAGALLGSVVGAIAGGFSKDEATTTLTLVENRSGVQIAAATGSANNFDFAGLGGLFGGKAGGAMGAYTNTPEGKMLIEAFTDSMNQLVIALREYKAQTVKGGLGKGGTLQIGD